MLAFLWSKFVAFIFLTWTPTFLKEKIWVSHSVGWIKRNCLYTLGKRFGGAYGRIFWPDRLVRRFPSGPHDSASHWLIIGPLSYFWSAKQPALSRCWCS